MTSHSDLVVTPAGRRPRSRLHHVPKGARVVQRADEVHVERAGELLEKFDLAAAVSSDPVDSGWNAYTRWYNLAGLPVTVFATNWTVPRPPTTSNGQVIFLFNGIEPDDQSRILQPVLQWGVSGAGGGDFWAVASWWVGSTNTDALFTDLVPVSPGDPLVGLMQQIAEDGQEFSYTCEFDGIAGTKLTIAGVSELKWLSETLEADGITARSDFPDTDCTPMTQILIRTAAGFPAVSWQVYDAVADLGQHAVVAVDGAADGEVELYYGTEPAWAIEDLMDTKATLAAGDPVGYTWIEDTADHVIYRGIDNHVYELRFDGSWHVADLAAVSVNGAPDAASDPSAYTFDVDRSEHAVYLGFDQHIHELWNSGQWHHNDLTLAANAPLAGGAPFGYSWPENQSQHVVYRGTDGHIHELWATTSWHHNDLTGQTGAPPPAGEAMGYPDSADGTEHVVYRTKDGHIHELYYDDSWHHNDLTQQTPGTQLAVGDPFGCTWEVDNTQRIVFLGDDLRVYELRFDGSWNHHDVTDESGGSPPAGGDPRLYPSYEDRTLHAIYRGEDDRIHDLRYTNEWTYDDLMAAVAVAPPAQGAPTGYTSFVEGFRNVIYRDDDNHLRRFFGTTTR